MSATRVALTPSSFLAALAALAASAGLGTPVARAAGPPSPGPGISQDWLHEVTTTLAAEEYHFTAVDGAWGAPNRAQGLRTIVDGEGFRVEPRTEEGPRFTIRFAFVSLARRAGAPDAAVAAAAPAAATLVLAARGARDLPAVARADGARLVIDRDAVEEWLVNEPRGIEHGFTLPSRSPGDGALVLTLRIEGSLHAAIESDTAVSLREPSGRDMLRYDGLAVRDANGAAIPARFSGAAGGRLAIVIDDARAVYPLTVDPLLGSASWTVAGGQAGGQFGTSVSVAGDVNGDGYSDVIVGSMYFDNGLWSNAGRAQVFLGSAGGLATSAAWSASCSKANARCGGSLSSAGDVNGDGYDDVVIAAEADKARVYLGGAGGLSTTAVWSDGFFDAFGGGGYVAPVVSGAGDVDGDGFDEIMVSDGSVWVNLYYGGPGGPGTIPLGISQGGGVGFGHAIARAGDVNGDGYDDILVGAITSGSWGAVYLFRGSASGLNTTPLTRSGSHASAQYYGTSVAGVGDFNGDGYADFAVGAPDSDAGGTDAGLAELVLGSAGSIESAAGYVVNGTKAGNRFGQSVSSAGDVDGDGLADFIVGEPGYDGLLTANCGRVSLFEGTPTVSAPLSAKTSRTGPTEAAQFGQSVFAAGDVNGDGFGDIVIGAPLDQATLASEGRAFVYHGTPNGLASAPVETLSDAGNFGLAIAAGDENGDGFSDVLVGAPDYAVAATAEGCVFLFRSSAAGVSATYAMRQCGGAANTRLGAAVAFVGDIDGDGAEDMAAGAPDADSGAPDAGMVKVWNGGDHAEWARRGQAAGARLGEAVGGSDVNGDGHADLVVGGAGRVAVYFGSDAGLSDVENWAVAGGPTFGTRAAGAGDVDGDGYGDLVVGEPGAAQPAADAGAAHLYLGGVAGLPGAPTRTWRGSAGATSLGQAVGNAGDVNGDGYSDLFVTADRFDVSANGNEGRVEVFYGGPSGPGATADWSSNGDRAGGRIGFSAASAGDVNNDGYSDLAVGAPYYANAAFASEGKTMVFHGSSAGLPASPSWSLVGESVSAQLGRALAGGADTNGDGFADLLVSAGSATASASQVRVFHGAGKLARARTRRQVQGLFSNVTVALGAMALEADAIEVKSLLRSAAGRTWVRVEGEAKPLGVPFGTTGHVVASASQTSAPDANGSTVSRTITLGGLDRKVYRWRTRLLTPDPRFPHTAWLHLAGNARTEADIRMNGAVAPAGVANVRVTKGAGNEHILWDAVPNAATYDVQRGALGTLRTSGGNFTTATNQCVANDFAGTSLIDGAHPSASDGLWYLVRANNALGAGTYDEGAGQVGARDAEIGAAAGGCP